MTKRTMDGQGWWLASFLILIFGTAVLAGHLTSTMSSEDRTELNYLNSSLRNLEVVARHPDSQPGERLRNIECENYQKRAARYLKIPAGDIVAKVERYVTYCRQEK